MKEYRLAAWTELPPPFDRTVYRRMMTDMSHRFVSESQLAARSHLSRGDVRQFLVMLTARGLVAERSRNADDSVFGSLRPLGGWLRKALTGSSALR